VRSDGEVYRSIWCGFAALGSRQALAESGAGRLRMTDSFQKLKQTWLELGRADPLWAVATRDDTRGGKWDLDEFFGTGEQDAANYHRLLSEYAQAPRRFQQVLDFGCGVGRIARAWSARADQVVGVDISASMIENGRALLAAFPNVTLLLNEEPSLRRFEDGRFDLVYSHICLQHMPWEIASKYVEEFARVCRRGGWVAFQLPSRYLSAWSVAELRKWLVDHLPFGLDRVYRRWRHGYGVIFDMYVTSPETVKRAATESGLVEVHREPDLAAGPKTEGFIYIFRKPDR
jgi:SAM-dependent methyltransferase